MKQKSVAKNGFYKAILNIFNLLVPLIIGPYITGLLSKDLYASYNKIFAEFSIFLVIGAFGIYNYGLREISRVRDNPEKRDKLFTSLFLTGIISNIVMVIIYVAYAFFRSESEIELFLYLTMIIQIVAQVFYIEFVNEANEDYVFITKKTIIVRTLYLISILVFVRKPEDILPYSIVVSMTVLLNNIISYFYIKRTVRFNFKGVKIKHHFIPLFIAFLIANVEILYTQLDKVMLGNFVSDISVTEYTLPTTLVGMIAAVPLALISVVIPRLSSYIGSKDKEQYKELLNKTINNYMLIVIPMSIGMSALAIEIMEFYSKGKYTYIYPVLIAAGFARIIYGFQSIVINLVMYLNSMEKPLTLFLLVFGILNVIFNTTLLILGKLTPVSALVTTALSVLLFTTFSYFYTKAKVHVEYKLLTKRIIGYLAVSLTFFPIATYIRGLGLSMWPTIFIVMAICATIYVVYLVVSKDTFVLEAYDMVKRKLKK